MEGNNYLIGKKKKKKKKEKKKESELIIGLWINGSEAIPRLVDPRVSKKKKIQKKIPTPNKNVQIFYFIDLINLVLSSVNILIRFSTNFTV